MALLSSSSKDCRNSSEEMIQLVAVQMRLSLDDYWTVEAFRTKIQGLMEQAAAQLNPNVPALVVFPEDLGLLLVVQGLREQLSSVQTMRAAIVAAVRIHFTRALWVRARHRLSWVPALFRLRHKVIAAAYFDVFSEMANRYGVYLVAGSVILPQYPLIDGMVCWQDGPTSRGVYNSSFLFGPDGKVIGRQDKVHLIDLESDAALHLSRSAVSGLRVFATELGRVGIAICLDSFQAEVAARLEQQGAEILVQPSANPGPWTQEQQQEWLESCYRWVCREQRFAYGVNPMMTGKVWDVAFYGQSSITTAAAASADAGYRDLPPAPGFAAVAAADDSEEVLVVTVPRPGWGKTCTR